MPDVLLIAEVGDTAAEQVRGYMEQHKDYKTDVVSVDEFFSDATVKTKTYDTLVFVCQNLDKLEMLLVLKIIEHYKNIPIMILAEQIALYSYGQIDRLQNVITLQTPVNESIFTTLLKQMSSRDFSKPHFGCRFITDEPARMMVLGSGLLISTRMRNYSAGGAFLEYHGISLKVGDQIQISLSKKSRQKRQEHFQIHAKVVWIRDGENARSPSRGVGVQFKNS